LRPPPGVGIHGFCARAPRGKAGSRSPRRATLELLGQGSILVEEHHACDRLQERLIFARHLVGPPQKNAARLVEELHAHSAVISIYDLVVHGFDGISNHPR
jgi:hypothetical protein